MHQPIRAFPQFSAYSQQKGPIGCHSFMAEKTCPSFVWKNRMLAMQKCTGSRQEASDIMRHSSKLWAGASATRCAMPAHGFLKLALVLRPTWTDLPSAVVQ